jgi:integrase
MRRNSKNSAFFQVVVPPGEAGGKDPMEIAGLFYGSLRRAVDDKTRHLLRASMADNTWRSYAADIADFRRWCGNDTPFPTTGRVVAHYLKDRSDTLSPSTLAHRLAAIRFVQTRGGYPDPTADALVRDVMTGIRRTRAQKGWRPARAPALLLEDLVRICTHPGLDDSLRGRRDRALILVGFVGAFRQSELTGVQCMDLVKDNQGLLIQMGVTKIDQTASRDHRKALQRIGGELCPVTALEAWLDAAGITEGPVFRGIARNGEVLEIGLSHTAANRALRRRAKDAGVSYAEELSCHSLRAGFVTAARKARAQNWQIMRQTGHADERTLTTYDRWDDHFDGNAMGEVMDLIEACGSKLRSHRAETEKGA